MDAIVIIPTAIGLSASLIESLLVGLYFKNLQAGFLSGSAAVLGAMLPVLVHMLIPGIFFRFGLWLAGGKDVFGTAMLSALIGLALASLAGSVLGALAVAIARFKSLI